MSRNQLKVGVVKYRQVTIVHLNLSIDHKSLTSETPRIKINQQIRKIQALASAYQGVIYRITFDEKGLTVILAFGLYPQTQQDVSVSAILNSLAARRDLKIDNSVEVSCGISSGETYLSFIGQEQRDVFISGDPIYLSYLLMLVAINEKAGIIVDNATKM